MLWVWEFFLLSKPRDTRTDSAVLQCCMQAFILISFVLQYDNFLVYCLPDD